MQNEILTSFRHDVACLPLLFVLSSKQIAVSYQSLELLQEHGIAATDIAKLQAAGYHTVESVRRSLILLRNV